MKTWTIYRDRLEWTVLAPDLFTALSRAERWALKGPTFGEISASEESGEPLREPSTMAPYATEPPELRARTPEHCYMRNMHAQVLVLQRFGCTLAISKMEAPSVVQVLTVALRRLRIWHAATAEAPERVTVKRFKSGKRKGEIRWPKGSDDEFREFVLGKLARNEALELHVSESLAASEHTLAVLTELPPMDFDDRTALAIVLALVEDVKRLAKWPLDISAWADAEIARLKKLDGELASVEEHGFGPGTECLLKPDPHSTDLGDPSGRVTIRRVYVEESEWRGDVHYREFEHQGRSWCGVPVDCFEALTTLTK